jgi:hypothetical protein
MRRIGLTLTATMLFLTVPAMARAGGDKNAAPTGKGNSSAAKTTPNTSKKTASAQPAKAENGVAPSELQRLQDLIQAQHEQLAAQQKALEQQQREIDSLKGQAVNPAAVAPAAIDTAAPAATAIPAAAAPASAATPRATESSSINPAVGNLAAVSNSESSSLAPKAPVSMTGTPPRAAAQGDEASEVSPLQFKIGSAYLTPVGFMDLTGVWRSKDGGSGIGTNFAGIPYGGASTFQTNESEFRFSMQNSRIGFRVDADVKGSHVIGYMEADFLGNAPANLAVSSNSNTLRSRLYWVDLRRGSWEVLGGQTWSLATPNRVGVSPLPGDIFFSDNMDTNYQLGDVWGRIPEFRVAYHFPNDKAAFAIALDSPDQYMGGTNGSSAITLPACCAFYQGKELDDGTGTLGPPNRGPDIIAKLAFDPSKRLHFEVGGIARFFQLYNQTTATHFSATGGAGFVNLDFGITNGLRLLTHNYWSDGGGRYVFGQAPDLVVRADGSPSLMHSGSTVDGVEFTHSNTTVWGYYGLVYIPRNVQIDTTGCSVGWGFGPSTITGCPAPSSGQNRSIQEGSFGFSNNFWKDAKYGALSLIGQYSYVTRDPWFVATGQPNNAHLNMIFLDLRYTLPGSAPTMGKPGKE